MKNKIVPMMLACVGLAFVAAASAQPIDDRDQPVEIDFAACEPKQERVYVAFGSTTYEIVGPSRQGCVMLYGGEVENRTWDGFLDRICVVPSTVGRPAFPRTAEGLDLSGIEQYCTDFVLCRECGKPDTQLTKEDRVHIMKCMACGAKHPIKAKI